MDPLTAQNENVDSLHVPTIRFVGYEAVDLPLSNDFIILLSLRFL